MLRVDKITKPALRPFETVKDQVKAAVIAERRRDAALGFAKQLADRLKGGDDPKVIADETGAVFAETLKLKRYMPRSESGILFFLA